MPIGMCKWRVKLCPIAGRIDDDHEGNSQPSQHIECKIPICQARGNGDLNHVNKSIGGCIVFGNDQLSFSRYLNILFFANCFGISHPWVRQCLEDRNQGLVFGQ